MNFFFEDDEIRENVVSRRATSTPTPGENDNHQQQHLNVQSFGVTKQINQVLDDMKKLLSHGREVAIKHEDDLIPERDFKIREQNKSRRSKTERTNCSG